MMRRLGLITLALTLACTSKDPPADGETGDGEAGNDPIGLLCDPSSPDVCEAAGGLCCSDDPAALSLIDPAAQVLPKYQGRAGEGTPIFSGANNPLSRRGLCVAEGSVPPADALADINAQGCPVPCNPRWSAVDIATICGPARVCCQIVELQFEDCVIDLALGNSGCWRPVIGDDIAGLGGLDATSWSSSAHATHQDPSGTSCQTFVAGIPPSVLDSSGVTAQELLIACFRRLGVADIRGHCSAANACPFADPGYIDACEQRNLDEGRSGCTGI